MRAELISCNTEMDLSDIQESSRRSFFYSLRSVIFVMLGMTMSIISGSLLSSYVGLYIINAGHSSFWVGLLQSGVYCGFFVGGFVSGRVVTFFGQKDTMRLSWACIAIVTFALTIHDSLFYWLVCRFLLGCALAGVYASLESWLNLAACDTWRARLFSIHLIVVYISMSLGQCLLPIVYSMRISAFYIATVFYLLAILVSSLSPCPRKLFQNGQIRDDNATLTASGLFAAVRFVASRSPFAVSCCVANGLVSSSYFGLSATCGDSVGLTGYALARFIFLPIIVAMLIQLPLGYISDIFGRRLALIITVISVLVLCWSPGYFSMLGLSDSVIFEYPLWLLVAQMGMGVAIGSYGVIIACANDNIAADLVVPVSIGMLAISSFAGVIGPFLASLLIRFVGGFGLFTFCSLAYSIGFLGLYIEDKRRQHLAI